MSFIFGASPSIAATEPTVEPEVVSKAFLEYLAELVEVDGKLVHPTQLSDVEQAKLKQDKLPIKEQTQPSKEPLTEEDNQ
ncbi:hypothetical protein HII17_00275 [Thalassotalea sp. M1531]|uniref:Uncharacterized protein n=1 Tax=Thalassotalea algicola TaxID=2716224 RepID=A0A7Y0LBF7_9GAMM|nr:hypothetical protein [Thalassotalea algicola]NMP29980.1 hypothetical protein [Thalassotalea algicola]